MSKKKTNFDAAEVEQDEYYLPDEEEAEEEVSEKKPANDKKLELAILKEQNKAKQLENEAAKLEFEKSEAEAKRAFDEKKLESDTKLEERKIAVSEKANEISEQQIKADTKKAKRERILGYIKAGCGIVGVGLSTFFSFKKFREAMLFEETNSFRTATGKDAQGCVKDDTKDMKNLDKKF